MALLYFLLLIGILVTLHEFGHFIFARLLGVKVLTFSFGFGPKLLKKKIGDTEYCISLVPLGGYVKMLGDDPTEEVSEAEKHRAFNNKSLWRRSLIVLAGPLFNLIIPFFVFFLIFFSNSELQPSMLGTIFKDGPAWEKGLHSGDMVTAIDGEEINYWWELLDKISNNPSREIEITYQRDGEIKKVKIIPDKVENILIRELNYSEKVGRIQIAPFFLRPVIYIKPESLAEQAGLKSWDLITSVNGSPIKRWDEFEKALVKWQDGELNLELKRLRQKKSNINTVSANLSEFDVSDMISNENFSETSFVKLVLGGIDISNIGIQPAEMYVWNIDKDTPAKSEIGLVQGDEILALDGKEYTLWSLMMATMNKEPQKEHILKFKRGETIFEKNFKLKLQEDKDPTGKSVLRPIFGGKNISLYDYPDLIPNKNRIKYAIVNGFNETINAYVVNALSIIYLISGRLSMKELGGPILIADMAAKTSEKGWIYFFKIMIWISIGFGFINLVPIPVLDGGHLLIFSIEAIRRKPISLKTRQIVTYIGVIILCLLMILVFKNDIERKWDDIVLFFSSIF